VKPGCQMKTVSQWNQAARWRLSLSETRLPDEDCLIEVRKGETAQKMIKGRPHHGFWKVLTCDTPRIHGNMHLIASTTSKNTGMNGSWYSASHWWRAITCPSSASTHPLLPVLLIRQLRTGFMTYFVQLFAQSPTGQTHPTQWLWCRSWNQPHHLGWHYW